MCVQVSTGNADVNVLPKQAKTQQYQHHAVPKCRLNVPFSADEDGFSAILNAAE